jgi:protein-S-isoprenylcysteine O-methyltransferase Ste14
MVPCFQRATCSALVNRHQACTLRSIAGDMRRVSANAKEVTAFSVIDEGKRFFATLTENLTVPDTANFESDSLVKELTSSDKLGKRGEIYVAGQVALIFLVLFPLVDLRVLAQILGCGSTGLGGAIIVAGSNSLGKSLTPLPVPRENGELVTDGLFKHMRHPLYTGVILIGFGLSALFQDSTRVLFSLALTTLLYFKAEYEEQQLIGKFGEKYKDYIKTVKRFGVL